MRRVSARLCGCLYLDKCDNRLDKHADKIRTRKTCAQTVYCLHAVGVWLQLGVWLLLQLPLLLLLVVEVYAACTSPAGVAPGVWLTVRQPLCIVKPGLKLCGNEHIRVTCQYGRIFLATTNNVRPNVAWKILGIGTTLPDPREIGKVQKQRERMIEKKLGKAK